MPGARIDLGSGNSDRGSDRVSIRDPTSEIQDRLMAAIVQRLERQIVVLDVVGSIPTSRPILGLFTSFLQP